VLARLFKRRVGRGGDQPPQPGAGLIIDARWRTAAAGQLVRRAALAPAADEVAHRRGADAEEFGDLALGAVAALVGGDDLAAQVIRVGFHAAHSERRSW